MNTNQYTQKTLEALQAAQQLAVEYQHNQLEPEHLLHALASQEQGLIPQLLQKLNVDPGSFAAAVAEKLSALPRVSGSGRDPDKVYISQAADKVLSAAAREAKAMKDDYITPMPELSINSVCFMSNTIFLTPQPSISASSSAIICPAQ